MSDDQKVICEVLIRGICCKGIFQGWYFLDCLNELPMIIAGEIIKYTGEVCIFSVFPDQQSRMF